MAFLKANKEFIKALETAFDSKIKLASLNSFDSFSLSLAFFSSSINSKLSLLCFKSVILSFNIILLLLSFILLFIKFVRSVGGLKRLNLFCNNDITVLEFVWAFFEFEIISL